MEGAARLCVVYAHLEDSERLLYVAREVAFPSGHFAKRHWRVVAVGAEPPPSVAAIVRNKGFYKPRRTAQIISDPPPHMAIAQDLLRC